MAERASIEERARQRAAAVAAAGPAMQAAIHTELRGAHAPVTPSAPVRQPQRQQQQPTSRSPTEPGRPGDGPELLRGGSPTSKVRVSLRVNAVVTLVFAMSEASKARQRTGTRPDLLSAYQHSQLILRVDVLPQPLHSAASLLAQMELHGIASARTVAPAEEVAEAATEPGEAPDAATLRPPQGAGAKGVDPELRTVANDTASGESNVLPAESRAPGGADDWQSQPPPASGLQVPPDKRSSGAGNSSSPSTAAEGSSQPAAFAEPQQLTSARRTGSGGAQVKQLPDLGSGFGPADAPLRRSASDAGESGSWPPPASAGGDVSASGRHGSDELPGSGGRQLRSRSAAPATVAANGHPAPTSLISLAGAVLDQRYDAASLSAVAVSACSSMFALGHSPMRVIPQP